MGRTRRKSKVTVKEKLSEYDKCKLASLVQVHPCLWKLSDADYRKQDVAAAAWIAISDQMEKTVQACKEGWKALKDGLRYQQMTKGKPKKSGDPISDDSLNEDDTFESDDEERLSMWKFWEPMKFILEERPKRKTLCSLELKDGVNDLVEIVGSPDAENIDPQAINIADVTDEISQSFNSDVSRSAEMKNAMSESSSDKSKLNDVMQGSSRSNYDYQFPQAKKSRKAQHQDSSDLQIAASIRTLVDLRKMETEKEMSNEKETTLKYYSMYVNLDRMLRKLPEDMVEDLNINFICAIREKTKEFNK